MRQCKTYDFGHRIQGTKLGWSLAGPPLMSVYCYAFGDTLMDTGQAHMGREVKAMARNRGIRRVFLTHHHEDHSGNAAAISVQNNAQVFGHELAVPKMAVSHRIFPYQKYIWGKAAPAEIIPVPKEIETELGPMKPIHTPGHSKDHTVYWLPEAGVLFSGDLYLADRIKYFRADESIGDQIESLKKIAGLDFEMLLCCHHPRIKNGPDHIKKKLSFLEDLYGRVVGLWEKGMPEKRIFQAMGLKEDHLTRCICFGNVSMVNGIRSVVRHHNSREASASKDG